MSYSVHVESTTNWNNGDVGGCNSRWDHIGTYTKRKEAIAAMMSDVDNDTSATSAVVIDEETEYITASWDVYSGFERGTL